MGILCRGWLRVCVLDTPSGGVVGVSCLTESSRDHACFLGEHSMLYRMYSVCLLVRAIPCLVSNRLRAKRRARQAQAVLSRYVNTTTRSAHSLHFSAREVYRAHRHGSVSRHTVAEQKVGDLHSQSFYTGPTQINTIRASVTSNYRTRFTVQASKQARPFPTPLATGVLGCACLGTCVVSTNFRA